MKRKHSKQPSISSSSLRSSSSRTSRSKTNKVTSQSTKPSLVSQNIGSSSKKSFTCLGCHLTFRIFSDSTKFMKCHVMTNNICPKAYPKCPGCEKVFFEEKNLIAHQSKSKKKTQCHKAYIQSLLNSNFTSSQVAIPEINNHPIELKNIPEHLQTLINTNKNPIKSKHHSNLSTFYQTKKFENLNIHNLINPNIHSHFFGNAVMDPTSIHLKNKMFSEKIYRQNDKTFPNETNLTKVSKSDTTEQIIDFGNFKPCHRQENSSVTSKYSSSSLSNTNESHNISYNIYTENSSDGSINSLKKIHENKIPNKMKRNNFQLKNTLNHNNNDSKCLLTNNTNPCVYIPQQDSINIENEYHFVNIRNRHKIELENSICDDNYKDCLELITILMKYKVPVNNIYKELLEWKTKGKLTSSAITLDSLIKKAESRIYGETITPKIRPSQTNLICPSGRRVTVTSFDVDALIYDLISDTNLMQLQNTIFKNGSSTDPFEIKDSEFYADIETSNFYQATLQQKNINHQTEILVPIQLYMDETTIDQYSKLSLHPLVMTLLIFDRKTRNLSMSWRTLAYIPNFECHFGSKGYSVDSKHNDFHFCLKYLLNGIEKLFESSHGYYWDFNFDKYPNKTYRRKMKFVLGNVLGDAKGANVLCSRYGNNTSTHIARDCDVLTDDCDNYKHICCFHKQKELNNLSETELNQLSFRLPFPYNAFSNMDFGANCYGINGACAADPCHMFNKGVVERLPKIFMSRLTNKLVKTLDKHVGSLVTNYGNQSYRNFPNIKIFSKGISSSSKLRSDQNIARVMAIYLVLLTPEFEKIVVHKMGRKENEEEETTRISLDEYNDWILIFEETLILHSWIYLDSHPKNAFNGGSKSIVCDRLRDYMKTYHKCAYRKQGMGLNFLKFHQILHLWWIIRLFGSLYNVDTARCESHHRKKKLIAKQTQRRTELFDEQTAYGEYKYNLIIKAIDKAGIALPKIFEVINPNEVFGNTQSKEEDSNQFSSHGSRFILTFDYQKQSISAKWSSFKMSNTCPEFHEHILKGLFDKFNGYNHGSVGCRIKSIHGFTEYKLTNNGLVSKVIRACPNYRGENDWFDWVTVSWEEEGLLECQCLLFLDFNSIEIEKFDRKTYFYEGIDEVHQQISNGLTVLVHSIQMEDAENNSRECLNSSYPKFNCYEDRMSRTTMYVKNKLSKFSEMEHTYQIVDVDSIHSTSFVIPYSFENISELYLPGMAKSVIVLSPMTIWHKYFIDYYDDNLMIEGSNRRDRKVKPTDERYPYEG